VTTAGTLLYRAIVVPRPQVVPFATQPGKKLNPAFSPDGRLVVYAWDTPNQDRYNIYVQEIDTKAVRRLTNYAGDDCSPVFSPDGRYIAFTREHRDLMLVPSSGGPERRIAGIENGVPMGVDFAPDGKSIATIDRIPGTESFAIFLVSTSTGEKRQLTFPPPGSIDDSFRFSPDGQSLAFARGASLNELDVYVMPSGGGTAKRITTDNSYIGGVAWTADSGEIIFSSRRSGTEQMWRIPGIGGTPHPVTETGDGGWAVAISREGHRLAYDTPNMQDVDIWSVELSQPGNRAGARTKLIGSRLNHNPHFSPDGKRIAFSSDRTGNDEIWISNSDGSEQRPVTSFGSASAGSPRWSPDGKRLVFDVMQGKPVPGKSYIYLADLADGSVRRVSNDLGCTPSWSRDGQWIYFASNRSGAFQIWTIRTDGTGETQLTRKGGSNPKDSPDGRTVYYEKQGGEETEIWKIPAEGGQESTAMILTDDQPVKAMGSYWSASRDGIYLARRISRKPMPELNSTGNYQIQFFSFTSRRAEPIIGIGEYSPHPGGLDVSPDRRVIIYGQLDRDENDIMLINNFH